MKLKVCAFLFFLFIIFAFSWSTAQTISKTLSWKKPQAGKTQNGEGRTFLNFDEAGYNEFNEPFFFERVKLNSNTTDINVTLTNTVYEELQETNLLAHPEGLKTDPVVTSSVNYFKKEPYASVTVFPFRKNPLTGKAEKLVSFNMQITPLSAARGTSAARVYASSSALASGSWYKLSVTGTGIYKMDYSFLQSIGIDVNNVDPRNIRVYSNGGGMLPFPNAEFRNDDIQENAIYVSGESDGDFNSGDYVLFYGQNPNSWKYNSGSRNFQHQVHLYADNTYYFITVDKGPGKRIQPVASNTNPATNVVTSFDELVYHESDLVNLIKSGREWYGESVDLLNNVFTYNPGVPHRINSDTAYICASVVGRTQNNKTSTYTMNVNGANQTSVTIPSVPSAFYLDFAIARSMCGKFIVNSPGLKIDLIFSSDDKTAVGWINYVEVNYRKTLDFSSGGSWMEFRDARSVGTGNIAQYSIVNTNTGSFVWDVTDPINILNQEIFRNGDTVTFSREADTLRQYMLVSGASYSIPTKVGPVPNQNLHGLPQSDFIIVTHPDFLSAANRLAQFHHDHDNLSVQVVTIPQVFNEYSCGGQDVTAIRDFIKMFYDRASSQADLPKYVLLFGDGSYDNKSRFQSNTNYVTTYESAESLNFSNSYASDDYFGLLDDTEGQWNPNQNDILDVGMGRLPVKSLKEADDMVNKIIIYASPDAMNSSGSCVNQTSSAYGDWRNLLVFIGDDEDHNVHFDQTQQLADSARVRNPAYNIDKIYLDGYKELVTPGGERIPDAQDAILKRVQRGALLVTYVGHGGELGWAQERVLEVNDINNWTNIRSLPAFLTATCEFSRLDDPARTSAGEYVLLNPGGGGIGLFTTTRLAYSNTNFDLAKEFFRHLFERMDGKMPTMGDVCMRTKKVKNSLNLRNFYLLGDPALALNYPDQNIITSSVNSVPVSATADTLRALDKITVTGYVADTAGNKLTNFNGVLYPTVFDKASTFYTLANDPNLSYVAPFVLQKNAVHRGKVSVTNGDFSFSFIVPKDISFQFGPGKLSYYAHNGSEDASGNYSNIVIGGVNTSAGNDPQGPEVKIYMNDESFVFGGTTDENPTFIAVVKDTSGINTIGNGIGHDITARLDEDNEKQYVLNEYYESDTNSYQQGRVVYPFSELSEGRHTVKFKVWDVYNNSTEAYTEFVVASSAQLALNHVLNYPNPFTTHTTFLFEHNRPCTNLDVQIQVFTISGKLIKTLQEKIFTSGFRSDDVEWDGLDDYGNKIGRGTYVYKLRVRSDDGFYADKFEKLVILR